MQNGSLEHHTVDHLLEQIPAARAMLRAHRMAPTSRLRLADACAAVSVHPDELLAQLDDQIRRQARRPAAPAAPVVPAAPAVPSIFEEEYDEELALV